MKLGKLESLPLWAQNHIGELNRQIQALDNVLHETRKVHAITADGREWFTLRFDEESRMIFTCERDGTRPLFAFSRGDVLMVGRKAKKGEPT